MIRPVTPSSKDFPQPSALKSLTMILTVLLTLTAGICLTSEPVSAQQFGVSFQIFYDQLSPYGQWVEYPNYGYAWIPDAEPDFAPYSSRGHWVFTEYGWTWVSDYNWGWAAFHYGRWNYDDYYGWVWIPDNEWGPSWVTWRRGDGYYGWAPMRPGVSVSVSFGGRHEYSNDHWRFVRDRDFERSDMDHYYVDRRDHDRIMKHSTVINQTYVDRSRNVTYIAGPRREDVNKATGHKVKVYKVHDNDAPGQELNKDNIRIYRPRVEKNDNKDHRSAPSNVTNMHDVKSSSDRKQSNQSQRKVSSPDNRKQDRNAGTMNPHMGNETNNAPSQRKVSPPDKNVSRDRNTGSVNPQKGNDNTNAPSQRKVSPPDNNGSRDRHTATVNPQKGNEKAKQTQRPKADQNQNNNRKRTPPNDDAPSNDRTEEQSMTR